MSNRERKAAALFDEGLRCFQTGRSAQAEAALKNLLAIAPKHADALHLLGLLAYQARRYTVAAELIGRAVTVRGNVPAYYNNLGIALYAGGNPGEAAAAYKKAIALQPDHAAAHNNLGVVLRALGQLDEAAEILRRAVLIDPGYAEAFNNLGLVTSALGHPERAEQCYRRATELRPEYAEAHNNLGNLLSSGGRFDEALACFKLALEINPQFPEAYNNRGTALLEVGDAGRAKQDFEAALALRPDYAEARCNLGEALALSGHDRDALACFDRALALDGTNEEFRLNRALTLLRMGELEEGWKDYESRFGARSGLVRRKSTTPAWNGEDLSRQRILVWMEQGVADEILLAGMIPDLCAISAACIVECAGKLVPLFARSFPQATVIARAAPSEPRSAPDADFHVAAGSVPRWLRPNVACFPGARSYLCADVQRVLYWRRRLDALGLRPGLRVGFSWRSMNLAGRRALLSTRLDQWGPIFSVPGAHFVCIQYDECAAEIEQASAAFGVPLHRFADVDLFNDIDEAAALTSALDLVISAPTAVSVLAGALGVTTWQMNYGPDWQPLGTARNPWLPALRRFPRAWNQSWEEIIRTIAHELGCASTHAP